MKKIFSFKPPGNQNNPKTPMRKISLKAGQLLCPQSWIILNPQAFKRSIFAGVVEVRNAPEGFPHFVWPTDMAPGQDFSDEELQKVSDLCVKAYPAFQQILDLQIKLIEDPAYPGKFLNLDQWEKAVEVGFFHIFVDGLTENPLGYEPPYGAKIILKKKRNCLCHQHKQPLR